MEETDLKLPDKDSFYLKILRAGGFTVEGGLRVLRAYFNHMRDCPQYFKVHISSLTVRKKNVDRHKQDKSPITQLSHLFLLSLGKSSEGNNQ